MQTLPKIPLDKLGPLGIKLVLLGKDSKHRDYDRAVKLTKEYYRPLATGEGQEHLYKRFNRRESEADLKDVMAITQQVTPAWWNALATPARKVPGVKPVVNVLAYSGDQGEKQAKELEQELEHFAGDKDIDHYFASQLVDEGMIDPNAFCLLTFENFDNRYEKPDVFGEVIPAWDAWNFEYRGGDDLQWLWVHKDIQYIVTPEQVGVNGEKIKATTREGHKFLLYGPNEHIVFEQVRVDEAKNMQLKGTLVDEVGGLVDWLQVNTKGRIRYFLKVDDSTLYSVRIYAQKSRRTPAFRLGYVPDQHTGGRTMVSLLHPALPYFLKSIKAVREVDLTFAMHAFPKRNEFRPKCPVDGCQGGQMPDGKLCAPAPTGCGGTGFRQTITTTADHNTFPLPPRMSDMLDLSKLTHYDFPPAEGLKLMMQNVDELRVAAMRAVYNSDVFIRDTIQQTLGGKVIDMQSVYDALQPLALWTAGSRTTAVYIFAAYKDLDQAGKLTVMFRYPRHFKFESAVELLALLKAASTDGGVSQGVLAQMNMDYADAFYVDDPRAADKVKTMARFDPFAGKSEATVLALIAMGNKTIERNEVLWTNMAYIFDQAEVEAMKDKSTVGFYDMADKKQREIIEGILKTMMEAMKEQREANAPEPLRLGTDLPDEEPEDRAAEDGKDEEERIAA